MEVTAPASLSGMAIVEPAALNRKLDGSFIYFVEMFRVQLMLWINYVVMCLLLWQIWEMIEEKAMADCSGKLLRLELICVFLFEVSMLAELRNSLSIISLLWAAPARIHSRRLASPDSSPAAGAILAKEAVEEVAGNRFTRFYRRMSSLKSDSHSDGPAPWKLDGISCKYRAWCMLTVGIPSLVLNLALAYLGALYIMRSDSDSDMVMDTLAVVFVAEIEDFLYVAFTSDAMRYNLENMEPVELALTNRQRSFGWFFSSIVTPMLTAAATALVVRHTRHVDCPGFTWSLQAVAGDALRFQTEA